MVKPMQEFPAPDVDDLPPDLRERIKEETEQAGFTPNVFQAYGYKPSHFRPFFDYYDALVNDTTLSRTEVEMIVVATSGVNNCLYCVVAHGALLRIHSEQPKLADQIATNPRSANVSQKHRLMLEFTLKLTERPEAVTGDDLDMLRDVGFTDEEIWDIGSICAFFNLSNRMASVVSMLPNNEFYTMGRN